MAATATININGTISGEPTGSRTVGPIALTSAAAVGQVTDVALASGANTITVPANSTGCLIQLPATNTAIVTLKGATGDTGIALGKTSTQLLTWDPAAAPASFVLSSAAAQTLLTEILFF